MTAWGLLIVLLDKIFNSGKLPDCEVCMCVSRWIFLSREVEGVRRGEDPWHKLHLRWISVLIPCMLWDVPHAINCLFRS